MVGFTEHIEALFMLDRASLDAFAPQAVVTNGRAPPILVTRHSSHMQCFQSRCHAVKNFIFSMVWSYSAVKITSTWLVILYVFYCLGQRRTSQKFYTWNCTVVLCRASLHPLLIVTLAINSSQRISKVIRILSLGAMHVCTKFCANPSGWYRDISQDKRPTTYHSKRCGRIFNTFKLYHWN